METIQFGLLYHKEIISQRMDESKDMNSLTDINLIAIKTQIYANSENFRKYFFRFGWSFLIIKEVDFRSIPMD